MRKTSLSKRILSILTAAVMLFTMTGAASAESSSQSGSDGVEGFVKRLYSIALGREADPAGLNDWSSQLRDKRATGVSVAYGFIFSPEYTNREKTDEESVELMYRMFFGRESDPTGKAYWLKMLSENEGDAGRIKLFEGFANSKEFRQICDSYGVVRGVYIPTLEYKTTGKTELFVNRLYEIVLGRGCDDTGMRDWTVKLINKQISGTEAAYGFFASQEYLGRNRSDEEYVEDLYLAFLGRASDASGKAGWVEKLKNGDSRLSVFNGFQGSQEFLGICSDYGIDRGDPIREKTGKTVCIDPGHSSVIAPGYVPLGPGSSEQKLADASGTYGRWSGLKEYELTMIVSNKLKTELESRGYEVIMTRYDNNTPVDCVTRAEIANKGADIMVRIHADALSSSSANGAVAICISSSNPWNPQTYSGSRLLADCLIGRYCSTTGIRNRGVSEQNDMTGNNWSKVPCVLFEMGFMTNQSDDLNMADASFQTKMVKGLADGIDLYFEKAG